ncbi:MAG: hypothetical protein IT371_10370 [Deltaproteobacteria bacterium]|nr:hypothetical protein [Deltaproteobacteria bacterium]
MHCNPLTLDHCFLPWPSSFHLRRDSATRTGYRLSYAPELLPRSKGGASVDTSRYALFDGFSVGSQVTVYFRSGVSRTGLPRQQDAARSTTAESPIWLLEYDTGRRVPLFAETDANAERPYVPALIVRPLEVLRHGARYVVALKEGLRDAAGEALRAPEPFRRLRDGEGTRNPTLRAEGERLAEVFAFLERQGVARERLVLAWDFHTASEEAVTGPLKQMVADGLARVPTGGPHYTVTRTVEHEASAEPHLLREVHGEFEVPSYLASDDPEAWLKLDAKGWPSYRGAQRFGFRLHLPRCAERATRPLPVLLFGHGLFTSPDLEMSAPYHKKLIDRLCMVAISTPWVGLSEPDLGRIAQRVVTDYSRLPQVTDRLYQAQLNLHVLGRLVQGEFLKDAALALQGSPTTDGAERYYFGVSNGGIQGVVVAALSTEVERFVFNASAGWWSLMLQRSSDFEAFTVLMKLVYPDPLDRLVLLHLGQSLWDGTDPINYARRVISAPLSGRKAKRILLQEAKDDDQVPNLATRALVRALGLPLLEPSVEPVFGVTSKPGPLDAAYVQWNTRPPTVPPEENLPAPRPEDSQSGHRVLRQLDSCHRQLERFLRPGGVVEAACGASPCGKE